MAVEHAARTLQMLGEKARPALGVMQKVTPQSSELARRSLEAAIQNLSGQDNPLPFKPKGKAKRNRQ